jgi:thiol-disulfide isomerase/thioredoxin
MNLEILLRFSQALIIIGLGFGFYRIMNTMILARTRIKMKQVPNYQTGQLSILYFTTPTCVPCRVIQKPALQQVREQLGDRLQLIEVDATARPDMAKEWNVLSVPTTFLIDGQGIARFVNHGVTRADKLLDQIKKL